MKNTPATLQKRNALKRMWKETTDPTSFPHFIERACKDCGGVGPCEWQSSFTQTGIPEYRARCVECHRAYRSAHRRGPSYRLARNLRRRRDQIDRKAALVRRLGGKCLRCGYARSLASLTFHHLDPHEKEFMFGSLADRPIAVLEAEADKCELLCFNCHMEEHAGEGLEWSG